MRSARTSASVPVPVPCRRAGAGADIHAVTEDGARADGRHAGHPRIIEVQDGDPGRRQRRHELALRPGHSIEIAEELDVRHGDAGHDANVGAADLRQAGDMTSAPGAHFEDDPLDVVRRVEQGQGKPELVVEGPLVRRHPEGRGEAAVQQVLGRRLADGSRDADHPTIHLLACQAAQTKERCAGVRHDDGRPADGLPFRQVGRRASLEGRADEVVPVTVGDDGNVELTRQDRSGVDARSRDGDIRPDLFPAQPGREFRNGESHASRSRPIV